MQELFSRKEKWKEIKRKVSSTDVTANNFSKFMSIKPDKDVVRLKKQYMTMNKEDLVDRLIQIEEYVAIHNKRGLNEKFNKYK